MTAMGRKRTLAIWRSRVCCDKRQAMNAISAFDLALPTVLSAVAYYLDAVETG
jgi:hypothetical protein